MSKSCVYVLVNGKPCGAPVGFKMTFDDVKNRVRKYRPFCDPHQKVVDDTVATDDDTDENIDDQKGKV